jgi:hypothetical protein
MGVWWRVRQWVYARPPVAAAALVGLLLLVGFGGWESAHLVSADGATQASEATLQVAGAKTVLVARDDGRVVTRVVRRTRTVAAPGRTETVVLNEPVTRFMPRTVLVRQAAKTVANARTQTVVRNHTVSQTITEAQTVRQTVTLAPQETGAGPGGGNVARPRPTVTVTVTQTQTVTQAAVTVTVTTSKGH